MIWHHFNTYAQSIKYLNTEVANKMDKLKHFSLFISLDLFFHETLLYKISGRFRFGLNIGKLDAPNLKWSGNCRIHSEKARPSIFKLKVNRMCQSFPNQAISFAYIEVEKIFSREREREKEGRMSKIGSIMNNDRVLEIQYLWLNENDDRTPKLNV